MPQIQILDAASGFREMWTDKNSPFVVFMDQRTDIELAADGAAYQSQRGRAGRRKWQPTVATMKGDFRHLDYPNEFFHGEFWDPPHLLWLGQFSLFKKKYGELNRETWPDDIKRGAAELWRTLKPGGFLIFKWSDHNISYKKILKLFPVPPLTRQISAASKNKRSQPSYTYWFCFYKPLKPEDAVEMKVREFAAFVKSALTLGQRFPCTRVCDRERLINVGVDVPFEADVVAQLNDAILRKREELFPNLFRDGVEVPT